MEKFSKLSNSSPISNLPIHRISSRLIRRRNRSWILLTFAKSRFRFGKEIELRESKSVIRLNSSSSFSISSISFLVVECWPRAEASRISLDRSAQSNYPNSLIEAFFELKRVKRRLNKSEANFSISRLRDRVSQPGTLYIGVGRRDRIGINFASDCLWRTHRGDFMGL